MEFNMPVTQDISLAEEMAKWNEVASQKQQRRLMDMKMQQMPEELAMQRERYQSEKAMHQATMEDHQSKAQQQKFIYASNVSKMVLSKADAMAQAQGISRQDPRFQPILDQVGAPFRAQVSSAFGHNDDPSTPMNLQGLETLANYNPGEDKNHFQFISTPNGIKRGNTMDGSLELALDANGKPSMKAPDDPYLQGEIQRRKQANTGHVLKGAGGAEGLYSGQQANPEAFGGGAMPPTQYLPPFNATPPQFAGQAPLTPEQAAQLPTAEATPQEAARFNIQQQNGPRIQGPTIAEAEAEKSSAENNKKMELSRMEAEKALPDLQAKGKYLVDLLDEIKKHPGMGGVVGVPSAYGLLHAPGSKEESFRARLDQIGGQTFLQAFESLKGGGQITEIEGKKATDAIARLSTSQEETEFVKAAEEFQAIIAQGMKRAEAKAGVKANLNPAQDIHSLADDILRGK